MAAIAGISDDAGERGADLLGHRWDHLGQRVAVIGIARQSRDMHNELPATTAPYGCGYRDFDAKFIGLVRFPLADALHLEACRL